MCSLLTASRLRRTPGCAFVWGVVLCLYLLDYGAGVHSASTAELATPDLAGRRYIALENIKVYEAPTTKSRVIFDLPRLRMLCAESTRNSDWLEVRGTGTHAYPIIYQVGDGIKMINGKIIAPALTDHDDYHPQNGFVRANDVVDLDAGPTKAPLHSSDLTPVPALWEKFGVAETRQFVLNPNAPPYNSIVTISTISTTTHGAAGELCTGFFLYSVDIVATAAHCVPDNASNVSAQVSVILDRNGAQETIPVITLSSLYANNGNIEEDWALLRLLRKPKLSANPLTIHAGDDFSQKARVTLTTIGYPGDLFLYGREHPQGPMALSTCNIIITSSYIEQQGKSHVLNVHPESDCIVFHGSAGGPALV